MTALEYRAFLEYMREYIAAQNKGVTGRGRIANPRSSAADRRR